MEYLRGVILEAAQAEDFRLDGEYTSMRVTVLPDRSISLTLTENKSRIKVNDLRGLSGGKSGASDGPSSVLQGGGKTTGSRGRKSGRQSYGFIFDTMDEVIACCRQIVAQGGKDICKQSLYLDEEYMTYYLFLDGIVRDDPEFNRMALALNEFGDFFNEGPAAMAFIREHGKCIAKENAAEVLAAL